MFRNFVSNFVEGIDSSSRYEANFRIRINGTPIFVQPRNLIETRFVSRSLARTQIISNAIKRAGVGSD